MRSVEVPEYEVHGEVRVDPARTALVVVQLIGAALILSALVIGEIMPLLRRRK